MFFFYDVSVDKALIWIQVFQW